MEEKYKKWTIIYDEASETFIATDPMENTLKSQKLKELKKKIDKFSFKRIPIIYKGFYSDDYPKLGEITSIIERGSQWRDRLEVWVSYIDKDGDKGRTKTDTKHLYKQTDNNMKIFTEITTLVKEQNKLGEKITELDRQLEKITKEDLGIVPEKETE